jgi:dimeric dUTPase (all-alpha-NTP-PPase superfamily)
VGERWRWLESTARLQSESFGIEVEHGTHQEVAAIVKENVLPLIVEAVELLREVSWKYWAHDEPFVNRDRVIEEAVDVAHFLGNILVAMGATDEEWEAAYQAKQAVNAARQRDGYRVKEKT